MLLNKLINIHAAKCLVLVHTKPKVSIQISYDLFFLLGICFELFGCFGVRSRPFADDCRQLLMCASVMHATVSNLAVPRVASYCCADKQQNTPQMLYILCFSYSWLAM